jgi:hypothetical protein
LKVEGKQTMFERVEPLDAMPDIITVTFRENHVNDHVILHIFGEDHFDSVLPNEQKSYLIEEVAEARSIS